MSGTSNSIDGIMLFEQPFARVPYENYRKVFRTSQKQIEKELGALQTTAADLVKKAQTGQVPHEEGMKAVEGMIKRAENLKRKLADLHRNAGNPTIEVMRERLQHLAAVETMQLSSGSEFDRWADTRLDRWLTDWALRSGKERTARKLAQSRGIERLVDLELFADIRRIEDALGRRSCTEALAWCSENKTALRKLKNPLEFELRLQELIELARAKNSMEAIAYYRKHLMQWQDTHLAQTNQAVTLLAYPPEKAFGPYKRLYDPARWTTLIQSFRLAIYTLSTLPTEPLLHLAMYGGLASLKLPTCYDHDGDTKNIDCPVCDPNLGLLAKEVPFSHHVNSTIVCRLTGKIMDENNSPLAFPVNGHVYSKEGLEDMATLNDGMVTCPRTKEVCHYNSLRRVFIS